VNITPQDRKAITAEGRRIARTGRVRMEIRRCWIEAMDAENPDPNIDYEASTFNLHGVCFKDIDDNYSYRYSYAEFAKHSKDDPRCNLPIVMLEILVAVPTRFEEWEPVDFIHPIFENGKLTGFFNQKLGCGVDKAQDQTGN
jgi:hypothetical protein